MALVHRALFCWFICLIFFTLLILRLDSRIMWSWFFVFAPIWFYDIISILYYMFVLITHIKEGYYPDFASTIFKKVSLLSSVLLKVIFQILLCLYLEQQNAWLSLHYVMIPFWINSFLFSLQICIHLKYNRST